MRDVSISAPLTDDDRAYALEAFAGLSEDTRDKYARDLARFFSWRDVFLGNGPSSSAYLRTNAGAFLAQTAAEAHAIVLRYRSDLIDRGVGSATINRRLSALRVFTKTARTTGQIVWALEVPGLDAPPAKRHGFLAADIGAMLLALHGNVQRERDACAIRLSWDLALRSCELLSIDIADIDAAGRRINVLRKGRREKAQLFLTDASAYAIGRYLCALKEIAIDPTPLFVQFGQGGVWRFSRLSDRGWRYALARRSRSILGRPMSPHALRHAAITCALEQTNGNVARVQDFSEHRDVRTVLRYDEHRNDDPAWMAQLVSNAIRPGNPQLAFDEVVPNLDRDRALLQGARVLPFRPRLVADATEEDP